MQWWWMMGDWKGNGLHKVMEFITLPKWQFRCHCQRLTAGRYGPWVCLSRPFLMSLLSSPVAMKQRGRKRRSVLVEKNTVKKKTWKMRAQKRSVTEIGVLGQEEKICLRNKQNFIIFPYKNFWQRRIILLVIGKFGLLLNF